MAHPTAGFGHNPADKEAGWTTFTVTPSKVSTTHMKFLVTDSAHLLTSVKMIRAVILDAIDQWIIDDATQIATNSITIGNAAPASFGGSDPLHPGDGGYLLNWVFQWVSATSPYATTPTITNTDLSEVALTVEIPYADVI